MWRNRVGGRGGGLGLGVGVDVDRLAIDALPEGGAFVVGEGVEEVFAEGGVGVGIPRVRGWRARVGGWGGCAPFTSGAIVGVRGAAAFAARVAGVLLVVGGGPVSLGFEPELRLWDGMVVVVVRSRRR